MKQMTLKEQLHKIVDELPDHRTEIALEEMHYRLSLLQKLQQGIGRLDEGEELSQEQVRARMKKWQSD